MEQKAPASAAPLRALVVENKGAAHSSYYLRYLLEGFAERPAGAALTIVAPEELLSSFPDLRRQAAATDGVVLDEIPRLEWSSARRADGWRRLILAVPPLRRHLRHRFAYGRRWRLVRERVDRIAADTSLLLSLDDALGPMLRRPPRHARNVSGIYFKPAWHVSRFSRNRIGPAQRLKARRQRGDLLRFLASPWAGELLMLDPFAVDDLAQVAPGRVHAIPEPARFETPPPEGIAALRNELRLEPGRTRFLLFGAISARRGIHEVLAAFARLAPAVARRTTLLLVGPVAAAERSEVARAIGALRDTPVEIRTVDRTIQEAEISLYFALADVVLVTHRRHVGSSGNLVFAAAAGLPVIATDEGLIGALVSAHELGTRVDSGDPRSIAAAIERLVSGGAEAEGFSPSRAREFALRNSPEAFAETILKTMRFAL